MQNQNVHPWSWGQGSAPTFSGAHPMIPTSFPPPGVDQNSLISGYQQMYGSAPGQPAPEYGQWTAAQLQQWQQWQQWQEKYQQWQAQYGKKYAESLAALGQSPNLLMPGIPPMLGIQKPVETAPSTPSVSNPPLPANSQPVPPPPPDEEKPPLPFSTTMDNNDASKNGCQSTQDNPEELSEAEKTFDVQFKQWEGQFNEWKKQNQDHPDKAQYREYEKKWETWREQLLQRREQMRKKRLNKSSEPTSEGKTEDSKPKATSAPASTSAPSKPAEAEYSYNTLGGSVQGPFTREPTPNFENKVPFFEKPQDGQSAPPSLSNFSQLLNSSQEKKLNQPVYSSNNFGGYNVDKVVDLNRQGGSFSSNQNFNQNSGVFTGSQATGFDGGQEKIFNPNSNTRFSNFEGEASDANLNVKFRNSNFEGPRFGGNFENFSQHQRFGNEERNLGPPQRFPCDSFRNERDFNQPRFFEGNREREMGNQNFGMTDNFDASNNRSNEIGDFRVGNCPPGVQNLQNSFSKPKVPSLFDITIEKPPNLPAPGNDRKSKVWEKYEKDEYFEDPFDKRQEGRDAERTEKPWANSSAWGKSAPSPWIQPWELEKLASQKPPETRPWDRESKNDNRPWMKDVSGKQEIDKAELSGYVGNILAKLGNFNVMPPNFIKNEGSQEEIRQPVSGEGSNCSQLDPSKRTNWNKGIPQRSQEEENQTLPQNNLPPNQSGDINIRNQNRSAPVGNFIPTSTRDYDHRGNEFNDRLRDGSFAPTNFDHLEDSRKNTDERNRFDNDSKNFDVDERISGRDDRLPFRRDERGLFGRDESRNFTRPVSRDDRRNFGNDDRFFGRDDRTFTRPSRDDRGFGRFSGRDDVDERFGNRNGRRGFDRFHRDDRDGRFFDRSGGPFDRFGRTRDQPLGEPVWNPQVFDYSLGRPQKLTDPDDGFKISTVVDYSHGENKQTFDYGHGEVTNDRLEIRSFDYGHKTEALTVIDYGHGVDKDGLSKDCRRDRSREGEQDIDERLKGNSGTASPIRRRSRSPRGCLRSHSRSPHSRFKRSSNSPPFRGHRSKSRDRLGRQIFKRDRNGSEDKLSPGDSEVSKHSFDVTTVLVEDLICLPGRATRPSKLVFIMRGIPGSGKTYVTKLIKDKEIELGGDPPRILSLDDYFMTEVEKEIFDKEKNRKVKTKVLEYEYEAGVEPHYRGSLLKAFKKTVSDGFFSFIIVDSINEKTKDYEEMWSFAKQKGFQVYLAEMDNDVTVCKSRNIHKRTEKDILDLVKAWEETPPHYLRLDVRSLLQSDAITEVEMEVVNDTELEKNVGKNDDGEGEGEKEGVEDEDEDETKNREEGEKDKKEDEDEDEPGVSAFVKSRWDQFENSEQNLDRLDGLKRRREEGFHATMEEYLQLPDDFDQQINSDSVPGKKRVRWADLEERRQQEKMRAIGFVVGQTDWNRMTDPTFGENALTRTKYI